MLACAAYILGPAVTQFEEDFAKYVGTRYCIGCGSGTDALHLALIAAGVEPGDEVITVSYTFVATVWAISYVGAKPVFVDIDPHTYCMDPRKLEAAITPKTKAVLPVHLYGHTCDMDEISDICKKHNLALIEDAAQAHGSTYKGKKRRNLLACHPASAFILAKTSALLAKPAACARMTRTWLITYGGCATIRRANVITMMNSASLPDGWDSGRHSWRKAKAPEGLDAQRHLIAKNYKLSLAGLPGLVLPEIKQWCESNWYLFVIQHPRRDDLQKHLASRGVETALHYPLPVHLQKAYAHLGYQQGDLPVSETVAKRCLTLPMFPEMTEEQIDQVTEAVREFCVK